MLFNSLTFLIIFLPIALLVYYLVPVRFRNVVLLVASLFFYAWGRPVYVLLLAGSIVFNWFMANQIGLNVLDGIPAMRFLAPAVVVNLALLGLFKYIGSFMRMADGTGSFAQLAVPLGISFFTLQSIAYLIDVYRGSVRPQRNIISFAVYISMFPKILGGPVVSYADVEKQLTRRKFTREGFGQGLFLFLIGLAKKVILANGIGTVFAAVLPQVSSGQAGPGAAWVGAISFMLQIYFDFSGYADMAIGLAGMFGFRFKRNFNYPYISKNMTDFQRRWNISVNGWFSEYVAKPLRGKRPAVSRTVLSLLIVWALTGFWYGASLTFIFWGLYCGVIMILERYVWGKPMLKLPAAVQHIYSLVVVLVGWVFFFSSSIRDAVQYLGTMFGVTEFYGNFRNAMYLIANNWLLLLVGILCCTAIPARLLALSERSMRGRGIFIAVMVALFVLTVSVLVTGTYQPFQYYGS